KAMSMPPAKCSSYWKCLNDFFCGQSLTSKLSRGVTLRGRILGSGVLRRRRLVLGGRVLWPVRRSIVGPFVSVLAGNGRGGNLAHVVLVGIVGRRVRWVCGECGRDGGHGGPGADRDDRGQDHGGGRLAPHLNLLDRLEARLQPVQLAGGTWSPAAH